MSNPTLQAVLGIDVAGFRSGLAVSQSSLKELDAQVKVSAANVALFEQGMKGGGTAAQRADLDKLRDSHRQLQVELKNTARQQAAFEAVNGGGGGGHGGGSRMAGMEAGHSVRSIVDMMSAGQNLGQALQMELPRLMQASGAGIGAMLATELATAIARAVESAIQGTAIERNKFGHEIAGSGVGIGVGSESTLKSQMGELKSAFDERLNETGNGEAGHDGNIFSWAARTGKNIWRKATGQKSVEDETDDKLVALEQRRIQLSDELVKRKAAQVHLDEKARVLGEDAVALEREGLRLKEQIAAVVDDKNMDATAQAHMIDLLREESKLRGEHIRQVREQHEAEEKEKHGNVMDRDQGEDSPVSKAQRAVEAAVKKRDATRAGSKEWAAAQDEVTSAEGNLTDAKTQTARHAQERADAATIAGMNAPQAKKERERLERERARLNAQLDPTSDTYERNDEKRKDVAEGQLPVVLGQLHQMDRSDTQRGFRREREQIAAETGLGPEEQIRAKERLLNLNGREQQDNDSNEKDQDRSASLGEEGHQLTLAIQELTKGMQEHLHGLQAQGAQIQNKGFTPTLGMKNDATNAKYDKEEADNRNDPAALAETKKNRAAELAGNQADEFMLTPAEKLDRQRRNDARQRAVDRASGNAHAKEADGNDTGFNARFHPQAVTAHEIREGAENAGKGDVKGNGSAEIVKAIHHPEWAKDLSFKSR